MERRQTFSVGYQVGAYLCLFGGILLALGYFAPWITYHVEGGYLNSTVNGWQAIIGGYTFSFPVGGLRMGTVVGVAAFILSLCPLLMAANALTVIAQTSLVGSAQLRQIFRRAFWPITILGTFELLLMVYALDPFGWDPESMWVVVRDPQPTVQPGLFLVCAGACAIIFGGMLMGPRGAGAARTAAA